ncbi:MAG TPA: c-type cytochrome [Anaeromyxobacteraceae bacterium]|nr:c-type cytochrome [Anaeromyxobacteraceae bacterium]
MRALPALLAPVLLLAATGAAASPAAPASPETLARGEQVARRFCLSCHDAPGGAVPDPLGPRLRPETWADPARAYENLGQLGRVNRRMDQPFTGPDDDRRALAAWLAWRADQNRPSPLRRAAPWIGMVAGGCAAVAIVLVLRRRGGRAARSG